MLKELSVQNLSVIEDAHIQFSNGFNVITGESGAGKSVLIYALALLIGERANRLMIRKGAERAKIQGVFTYHNDSAFQETFDNYDIEIPEDQYLIISRELSEDGRSTARLNGKIVPVMFLRDLGNQMVDIYGQSEQQGLLENKTYLDMLDSFIEDSEAIKKQMRTLLENQRDLIQEQASLPQGEKLEREIDLLNYQKEEIESLDIEQFDEDELFTELKRLSDIDKLKENFYKIFSLLDDQSGESLSLDEMIDETVRLISGFSDYGEDFKELEEEILTIQSLLQDWSYHLRNVEESIESDPERLSILSNRMALFENLKRKYGNSKEEIAVYYNQILDRLEQLEYSEERFLEIQKERQEIKDKLDTISNDLSKKRKKIAINFQKEMEAALKRLNMPYAVFQVEFDVCSLNEQGIDQVDFLFSANEGEAIRPLALVASGGEQSRIMLAFKEVLQDYNFVETLIFDEIDAGISGRTAQTMAERLFDLSKKHQIIAVSHLPQIASMADEHYCIEKRTVEDHTFSTIDNLKDDVRILEMMRLLGGADITETTKEHATEMLKLSNRLKENRR